MGIPISRVGESQGTTQRPRAEGQRTIQPTLGTTLALAPRRGGSGIGKAFAKRLTSPQTPPRRAFWGNDLVGTNTGTSIARSPKRRGAAGADFLFLCRWKSRTPTPKRMGQPSRLATRLPRSAQPKQPFYTPPKERNSYGLDSAKARVGWVMRRSEAEGSRADRRSSARAKRSGHKEPRGERYR